MRRTLGPFAVLAVAAALAPPLRAQQPVSSERCIECHRGLSDPRLSDPVRSFEESDIHGARGFGCLACHGGAAGQTAAFGFLSKPERRDIPALCGRCHSDGTFMREYNPSLRTDQVSEYYTSVHGHRLREFNDPNVATCVDCHPPHGIRSPGDPESTVHPLNVAKTCGRCHSDPQRMAQYGIPTDQEAEYRTSIHGQMLYQDGDLSAPTCNDCHGNHGAAPPGVNSIRNVCGQCHATMADFFAKSGHVELFEQAGLPGCETCHGNHAIEPTSDELLAQRSESVCGQCHQPGDSAGSAFTRDKQVIDSLKAAYQQSEAILSEAANAGMEVSQAEFELKDVNNALTLARNAIHSFHVDPVAEQADAGFKLTQTGFERGEAALGEHHFRRVGLGVATLIILGLIAGLALKIRQIEGEG